MTNPKPKHLKEGMVEAFLKKMRLRVYKDTTNDTYSPKVSLAQSLQNGKLARQLRKF
jgi:hypothetical protein